MKFTGSYSITLTLNLSVTLILTPYVYNMGPRKLHSSHQQLFGDIFITRNSAIAEGPRDVRVT